MSHDPVTLVTFISGDLIICLVTVSLGSPVISEKNVEEKSIKGEIEVTAAVSLDRFHDPRLTYTHHTNERA